MPHIQVEYPDNSMNRSQVNDMLRAIHHAVANSRLYPSEQIRLRAQAFEHYSNGGTDEPFIHITARIKSGRAQQDKTILAEAIVNSFRSINTTITTITAEVVDMDRASYSKFSG